jgi:hypothetical protein
VCGSLLLLLQGFAALVLCQASSDGTGLLCAEVEWKVLLALVEQTELCSLVGVDDGEDLSDRLADVVTTFSHPLAFHSHFLCQYRFIAFVVGIVRAVRNVHLGEL